MSIMADMVEGQNSTI